VKNVPPGPQTDVLDWLRDIGLVSTPTATLEPLTGGVSSDISLVVDGKRRFVVKRALPKLRVKDDWQADPRRNRVEQDYLRWVGAFQPDAVPAILASHEGLSCFAMEYLGPGYTPWKTLLLAGNRERSHARRAGHILGTIHARSWSDPEAQSRFNTTPNFHQLRTDPYLLTAARRQPDLGPMIVEEARRLESRQLALVHGDYSPKNLLATAARLVVLDCEVAWYGDPAFDLAFLLNHLLLKALKCRDGRGLLQLAGDFLDAYRERLGSDRARTAEEPLPRLLPMLMLARVDGKSPVEYLTPDDQAIVRRFSREQIVQPPENLPTLFTGWQARLGSC